MQDQHLIEKLIIGCERRDPKSQEMLYRTFFGFSMSVCLRYSNSEEDALEILNNSFLKVFNRIQQLKEPQAFKSWLRSILIHSSLDYLRKVKKYEQPLTSVEPADLESEGTSEGELSHEEILEEVQNLPTSYRIVFNMYEIEGYSHREIAKLLGISESTSRSHLTEAKKRLRKKLKRRLHLPAFFFLPTGYGELLRVIKSSLNQSDRAFKPRYWERFRQMDDPSEDTQDFAASWFEGVNSKSVAVSVSLVVILGILFGIFFSLPEKEKETQPSELPSIQALKPALFDLPKVQKPLELKSISVRANHTPPKNLIGTRPDILAEKQEPMPLLQITRRSWSIRIDASPIGGFEKLDQYMEENFAYPDTLRKDSIVGRVTLNFDIDEKGQISNVAVLHGLHALIDDEVVLAIENMPAWQPTYINCKPIRANYSIPIKVKL